MQTFWTKFTDLLKTLGSLPTLLKWGLRAWKAQRKIREALSQFPGFDDSERLYIWCAKNTELLCEWALWTPITWDDQAAGFMRMVITDHWPGIWTAVSMIRGGKEVELPALLDKLKMQAGSNPDDTGDAATVLAVLSVVISVLNYISKIGKNEEGDTKRPILDWIRSIRGRKALT